MICPKCGYDNVAGDKFCVKCGTELKPAHLCPKCGAKLIPGEKFCGNCGTRLVEEREFPGQEDSLGSGTEMRDPEKRSGYDESAGMFMDEEETEEQPWHDYAAPEKPQPPLPWYKKYKAALIAAVVIVVAAIGIFAYTSNSSSSKETAYAKSAVTISTRLEQNNEHFTDVVRKLKGTTSDGDRKTIIESMKKDKQTLQSISKDYDGLTAPDKYRSEDASVKKMLKAQSSIYADVLDIVDNPTSDKAIDKANGMQQKLDTSKAAGAAIQIQGSKFASAGNMDAMFDYLQEFLTNQKKEADAQAKAQAAAQVSYFQYTNSKYGYSIDIPTSFQQTSTMPNSGYAYFVDNNTGARINLGASKNTRKVTVATLYNQDTSHLSNANITYTASGTNWYVIAYTRQGTSNYKKVFVAPDEIDTFNISFSAALKDQYEGIINHMEPSYRHNW